jgi:NAD(P)H-quinone oxidoreductase subunit 5
LLLTLFALGHAFLLWRESLGQAPYDLSVSWLKLGGLDLSLTLGVSPVSLGATLLITLLSCFAQFYALGYLEKDWGLARFFALMGFFEGAMCGLALSDSLLLSYCLLELLTLSTYLLVGFWYAQPLVVTAARDAFWTKRLGDVLLLMGVVALSTMAPSLNFSDLAHWAATDGKNLAPWVTTLLGLALVSGPTGKCAQFPLNLWLDEAMEGPNPASIMRNSVVVGTGAYVLIKIQPILALSPAVLVVLVTLGAVTALGASLVALAQVDIKRAFCHSTSAYLGLVFIAVGMQQTEVALVLLFVHALAKALLFMSVGSIIYTTSTQNVTELGGLWSRMPATTTGYLVASAGLVALFPLGSLWALSDWAERMENFPALLLLLLVVNGLTAFNLARVYTQVFTGSAQRKSRRAPEVPWPMALPLVSLSIMVLLIPQMLATWGYRLDASVAALALMGSGLLGGILGFLWIQARRRGYFLVPKGLTGSWQWVNDFLANDFYLVKLYKLTIGALVNLGAAVTAWIDRNVVEGVVSMVSLVSLFSGQVLRYANSGQSQTYMITIMAGVIIATSLEMLLLH